MTATSENAPPASRFDDDPGAGFIDAAVSLGAAAGEGGMTLGEMADRLDRRAFGVLILLLTLPCLVPGLPGAQIIAIPIFLLALQMAAGRKEVWLPRWVLRLRVRKEWIDGVAGFADKRLRWTERLSKPRLQATTRGAGERLIGLVIALASVTIMLPITNTIPSFAILLAGAGLLQRDGLFTLAGAGLALAWIGALIAAAASLALGAGFAVRLAQDHAPWLADLFGR